MFGIVRQYVDAKNKSWILPSSKAGEAMSTLSAISLGSSWETKEVENLVAFVDESSPTRQVMNRLPLTKRPHKVL